VTGVWVGAGGTQVGSSDCEGGDSSRGCESGCGAEIALDLACWMREDLPQHLLLFASCGMSGGAQGFNGEGGAEGEGFDWVFDLVEFVRQLVGMGGKGSQTQAQAKAQAHIVNMIIPRLDPTRGAVTRDLARVCHELVNNKGLGPGGGGMGRKGGALSQLKLALLRLDMVSKMGGQSGM